MIRTALFPSAILLLGAAAPSGPVVGQAPPGPPSRGPGGIVGIVNQDVITRDELDRRVMVEMEETARRRGIDPITLERERARMERWVLDGLIEQRLLLQDAKKNDIKTSEEEIDWEINRRIEDEFRPNGLNVEDAEELYKVLKEKHNYSREEYRALIRDEILINRLLRTRYFRNPFVTPGEMREYYRDHPEEFETPSEMTFRMIAVDNDVEAPRTLDALDAELDTKRPFEEVASGFYAGRGEDAWLWKRNMDSLKEWLPPLPEVIEKMRPGEIRRRIRVPSGWRYIEMAAVKPGKKKSFEEAQPKILESLLRDYRIRDKDRVVEKLRKEAHLQDFLPPPPSSPGRTKAAPAAAEIPAKVRDISPDTTKPKSAPKGGAQGSAEKETK